jgi:hypothetical protein
MKTSILPLGGLVLAPIIGLAWEGFYIYIKKKT